MQPNIGQNGAQLRERARHWLEQSLSLLQVLPASFIDWKQAIAPVSPALPHRPPSCTQAASSGDCGAAAVEAVDPACNAAAAAAPISAAVWGDVVVDVGAAVATVDCAGVIVVAAGAAPITRPVAGALPSGAGPKVWV